MNKKIFRSCIAVALLVLLSSLVLIMGISFRYFETQLQSELESEAKLIAHALAYQGSDYFDRLDSKDKRITLISPQGQVIVDTIADERELGNHFDRVEVVEARNSGKGSSIRYSDTLAQETIYFALRLEDGNILRVSTTQDTVAVIILRLLQPILIVLVIAFVLSFLLAQRVSKAIIQPINDLNLDDPLGNEPYDELAPLLRKIAKQKKTIETQIREAKQKQEEFRLMTENMREGFLVVDCDRCLLSYNQAALRILDRDEAELSHQPQFTAEGFGDVLDRALAGERAQSELVLDECCYQLIASPVYENDRVIGAVVIMIDVSESVKREQLRREFTSNVSHELKTPLTSISGFAEMMKEGNTPPALISDFATSIYEEAQRLIQLVNDIIKLSELDEKSIAYDRETVDLYALSTDIIKRLSPIAAKRHIQMQLIGEPISVMAVPKILDEMLFNLCDNAIKYNHDHGSVAILLSESAAHVTVTVRDSGIGIAPADQKRIFERFYRVDKSHSKAIGGTGLGLSIVKHGALYHRASIDLRSELGKGTVITLTFPKQTNR